MRLESVISLAITAALVQGCWCDDDTFVDEARSITYFSDSEGLVNGVDPFTQEGCEILCNNNGNDVISEISSCEATMTAEAVETDTGLQGPTVEVACVASGISPCVGGRHSAALLTRAWGEGHNEVGAWLAREAHGEAGSVIAFRRLARELKTFGAPESLVERAHAAAREEVLHARLVRKLAVAAGGVVPQVRTAPFSPRSLLAIAMENAVEGCVAETFAAALAAFQARVAPEPVAKVAAMIAPDELRHAQLAAEVHAWACGRLLPADAAKVERARLEAWQRLVDAPAVAPEPVRAALGLPSADQVRALAVTMASQLQRAAA